MNLENYSSWLVIWRFCVTREEPEFFYRYSWFYYSILRGPANGYRRLSRVTGMRFGIWSLDFRDFAFFKHCFYCKNRSLKRVFYSLIFVNRENEIVMPVIRDVHESCQRPPCTTLDENHQGQATHKKPSITKNSNIYDLCKSWLSFCLLNLNHRPYRNHVSKPFPMQCLCYFLQSFDG